MIPVRRSRVVLVKGKEPLLFNPDAGSVYKINETALMIYELCDGKHTVNMIAKELTHAFSEDPGTIRKDLDATLKYLHEHKLLTCKKKRSTSLRRSS